MKKLTVAAALSALSGHVLFAQDFTGTWQGTLQDGPQSLRIVMKIAREGGKLTATHYSIDQTGQPFPASAVTQNGSAIRIAIPRRNGTYEGKLTPDGKAIDGTWSQETRLPLNLVKATSETAWSIPEPPPPVKMMAEDAKPEFEVSTIKPARPEEPVSLLTNRNGTVNTTGTSLSYLIKFAWDLHAKQIVNGPSWLESERFDVTGKPDTPGVPRLNHTKSMVQKLLADRFGLRYHLDKRELNVYAITVMKGGIKVPEDTSNPNGLSSFGGAAISFRVANSTIAEFAAILQAGVLDQPVIDQTGLGKARYTFILKFMPDQSMLPPGASQPTAPGGDADRPPDLFTAFEQQLGLQIRKAKAQADVFVIDHVERPSAN